MNTKKLRSFLPVFASLLLMGTLGAKANTIEGTGTTHNWGTYSKEYIAHMTKEQKEARIQEMKDRVKEIKAIDKSTLTKADRKALRKELRTMNKEARDEGYRGVYISIGALIIIILLLIIIL